MSEITAPDKIMAWPDYPDGWVTGVWSANTYDSEVAVEYTRTATHPVTVEMLEFWFSVMTNSIAADEISAAIAKIRKAKS